MKRRFVKRAAVVMLILANFAAFMICRRADGSDTVYANSPASAQNAGARHARTFSQAYEICAEDSEGRPLVVRRKKVDFYRSDPSPRVNEQTFIETEECHYSAF